MVGGLTDDNRGSIARRAAARAEGKSMSRSKREKPEAEKPDRKQLYAIIAAAAAAVIVVVVIAMSVMALRGPKDVVDTRTDTDRYSAERQAIEKSMQEDIDHATARG